MTPRVDVDITEWVADHRVDWLTSAFRVITTIGNTAAMTAIAVVAAVVLWRAGRPRPALTVLLGSMAGWLLMQAIKHAVARDRPPERFRLIRIDTHSFPSGHAMMSAIVLGLVAVAAWQTSRWVRRHAAILLIAPVASLLIGASRVYLGVHWTTDVIAGWVLGFVWIVVSSGVARVISRGRAAPTASRADSPGAAP